VKDAKSSRRRATPAGAEVLATLDEPERAQVTRLLNRMNGGSTTPESVGRVLPQAVVLRSKLDSQLPQSFVETTEKAIKYSVERDSNILSDSLFLVIGPAVRKALAKFMREVVESLNTAFDRTLSPRSIGWRIKAMRSGRSFADLVMEQTLAYRVEQVFLVHKNNGLLLRQVSAPGSIVTDPDMVSAMLQAVQDFTRDSLKLRREESVESISVGRFTIMVEPGPLAVIALVVQGTPPPSLRMRAQETLETTHMLLRDELAHWEGGQTAVFEPADPILRACLQSEPKQEEKRFPIFAALFGLILLAGVGFLIGLGVHRSGMRARLIDALDREPGIVVIESRRHGGHLEVTALQDPLAADPQGIALSVGYSQGQVAFRLKPYSAGLSELTLERVRQILNPPSSVTLSLQDGVVTIGGAADAQWLEQGKTRAVSIPGVRAVQVASSPGTQPADVATLSSQIESFGVLYQSNSAALVPGQETVLDAAASAIMQLAALGRNSGVDLTVTVTGHSAGLVSDPESYRISHDRAADAVRRLRARGVSGITIIEAAAGVRDPAQPERGSADRQTNRRVSFSIEIQPGAQ
jgi:outer membrane protein OmpA-like peptidoglycan-associated protein